MLTYSNKMLDLSKLEKIKRQNGKIICQCPACFSIGQDSSGNHMIVFPDGKFGCCVNSDKNHYRLISKLVGREILDQNNQTYSFSENIELPKKFDKEILNHIQRDHSYWINRSINPLIFNEIDAGLINLPKLENRHSTVIYNQTNDIVGLAARSLDPKNKIKWKLLGGKKNFTYPLHLNRADIIKKSEIILVESIGDLFSLLSVGIRNVLVLFGTDLSSKLLTTIISLNPKTIKIATNFDENEAGQNSATKIKKKLLGFFDTDSIQTVIPTKNDFNQMLVELGSESLINLFPETI